jgi:hypothetical protein
MSEPTSPHAARRLGFLWNAGGFFLATVVGMLILMVPGLRQWQSWAKPLVIIGWLMGSSIACAIWSARRHQNLKRAVAAPGVGVVLGAGSFATVAESFETYHEMALGFVILIVVVVYAVPIWLVSAMAGLVTVRVVRGRWRAPRPGHCPRCDYDLNGLQTPTCPECGADCCAYLTPAAPPDSR